MPCNAILCGAAKRASGDVLYLFKFCSRTDFRETCLIEQLQAYAALLLRLRRSTSAV